MSLITWTPDAVLSESSRRSVVVWRMVESQHAASTMKLVDTSAEQDILEEIIEAHKPSFPASLSDLDYLLAAPFRYAPYPPGSRFRSPTDPGVFYASESVRTAAAEVGYWRWRFLQESAGLDRLGPAAHTAFSVPVDALGVDLQIPPFDRESATWMSRGDYSGTQLFANVARIAEIDAIFYRSVRDPEPSWCVALLSPKAFAAALPDPATQTWHLAVTKEEAIWRRPFGGMYSFSTDFWKSG